MKQASLAQPSWPNGQTGPTSYEFERFLLVFFFNSLIRLGWPVGSMFWYGLKKHILVDN